MRRELDAVPDIPSCISAGCQPHLKEEVPRLEGRRGVSGVDQGEACSTVFVEVDVVHAVGKAGGGDRVKPRGGLGLGSWHCGAESSGGEETREDETVVDHGGGFEDIHEKLSELSEKLIEMR